MFLPQKINPLILVCSKILKHCIGKLSELFRSAPGNCYVPVAWEAFQWGPTGWVHRVPQNGSNCNAPSPPQWVPLGPNLSHSYPACLSPSHSECLYLQTSHLTILWKTNRPSLKPVRACALRPAKLREKVDKWPKSGGARFWTGAAANTRIRGSGWAQSSLAHRPPSI